MTEALRSPTAFVFPGQGPQEPAMLAGWEGSALFARHRVTLDALAGGDILTLARATGGTNLGRNTIASLVTVFSSALELERLLARGETPAMVAGYSVGQLTAMYAAGMLTLEHTLELVATRAALMEKSRAAADGAMLAVIGLATPVVEDVCCQVRDEGGYVVVANYNCLGQLTLSGTSAGVARAEAKLATLEPRKLARVPVQGAWHCALLDDVAAEYRAIVLDHLALAPRRCPVMDNVSGGPLPEDPDQVRAALASHLVSPVRWEQCVTTMAGAGVETFVEVGYGDMLTKFGFFIDRKKRHVTSAKVA